MSCCFSEEKACHSSAENVSTSSSQTAFTFVFPSEEKSVSNIEMSSALSVFTLYQELNS